MVLVVRPFAKQHCAPRALSRVGGAIQTYEVEHHITKPTRTLHGLNDKDTPIGLFRRPPRHGLPGRPLSASRSNSNGAQRPTHA